MCQKGPEKQSRTSRMTEGKVEVSQTSRCISHPLNHRCPRVSSIPLSLKFFRSHFLRRGHEYTHINKQNTSGISTEPELKRCRTHRQII